jgi:hypothetical protein
MVSKGEAITGMETTNAVRAWTTGTFGLMLLNAGIWLYALGLPAKLIG